MPAPALTLALGELAIPLDVAGLADAESTTPLLHCVPLEHARSYPVLAEHRVGPGRRSATNQRSLQLLQYALLRQRAVAVVQFGDLRGYLDALGAFVVCGEGGTARDFGATNPCRLDTDLPPHQVMLMRKLIARRTTHVPVPYDFGSPSEVTATLPRNPAQLGAILEREATDVLDTPAPRSRIGQRRRSSLSFAEMSRAISEVGIAAMRATEATSALTVDPWAEIRAMPAPTYTIRPSGTYSTFTTAYDTINRLSYDTNTGGVYVNGTITSA